MTREGKIIGIDLGGTRVRAALSDGTGNFLARVENFTEAEHGFEFVINNIVNTTRQAIQKAGGSPIVAIGIGAPGPLNPRTGTVYSPPNLPGWSNVPLRDILEKKLGIPVFLGNDANLAALGEYTFGAGKEYRYLAYITVSTGIGGGIIEDGRIIDGARGAAGEVGHMTIKLDGPRCNCGNYGCWEALASGTAIRRRALEVVSSTQPTLIRELAGNDLDKVSAELVVTAAHQGDKVALELLHEIAVYLGVGITNILHLFNPEIVVIGGGVSQIGHLLFDPMKAEVKRRAMKAFREGVPIVPTELKDDVGLHGAVALVLQNYEEANERRSKLSQSNDEE